jgi:hypothetical protein
MRKAILKAIPLRAIPLQIKVFIFVFQIKRTVQVTLAGFSATRLKQLGNNRVQDNSQIKMVNNQIKMVNNQTKMVKNQTKLDNREQAREEVFSITNPNSQGARTICSLHPTSQ